MYRILLVDDEILVRDAIKENIDWKGIDCELVGDCENGKEAVEFIKKHPVTKSKLKLNGDDKLILDTKISVEIFLKLLDDDYLQSELTKLLYDSRSKDGLND